MCSRIEEEALVRLNAWNQPIHRCGAGARRSSEHGNEAMACAGRSYRQPKAKQWPIQPFMVSEWLRSSNWHQIGKTIRHAPDGSNSMLFKLGARTHSPKTASASSTTIFPCVGRARQGPGFSNSNTSSGAPHIRCNLKWGPFANVDVPVDDRLRISPGSRRTPFATFIASSRFSFRGLP